MPPAPPKTRLFVDADLAVGRRLILEAGQAHYVRRVMRLATGDAVALFNGRDGEWTSRLQTAGKERCAVVAEDRVRAQAPEPDLWLAFAPLKKTPTDFIAVKATELGVSRLLPVMTRNTRVSRVNTERLRANAVEAAEQCGRLSVPEVAEPAALADLSAGWPPERRLVVLDETGAGVPIAEALADGGGAEVPHGFLIGPEGGFDPSELDGLRKLPFVTAVSLGPRLLRADTAAIAALVCWQALLGDWRGASLTGKWIDP